MVPIVDAAGTDFDAVPVGQGREHMPTGVYTGAEINIVNGGLDVEVLTGIGVITDAYSDPSDVATKTRITWPDLQKTITTPSSNLIAWIMIQESGTPGIGEIVELTTRPSPVDQRTMIYVGLISWSGAQWEDVSTPIVAGNVAHQYYEMMKDVFPPLAFVSGGNVIERAAFTLEIDASVIWEINRNHHVNPADPNRQPFGPTAPLVFRYITGGFESVGVPASIVDPTQWENPTGVLDPTVGGPANNTTIQRLWLDQADNFWVTWGQNIYSTFDEARASVQFDAANSVFSNYLTRDCILLGFIVCTRSSTDWSDESQFIPFVSGQS
ncbi:MAG: hypothetical protein DRH30_00965, partial [Deltaproteobacteria bacterium]